MTTHPSQPGEQKPKTDAIAGQICAAASRYKFGELNRTEFTCSVFESLHPLRAVERELEELRQLTTPAFSPGGDNNLASANSATPAAPSFFVAGAEGAASISHPPDWVIKAAERIADKANECCHRCDGYLEEVEAFAISEITPHARLASHAQSQARIATLEDLLGQLLFAAENADETGYVTDVGFIQGFDQLHDKCRLALNPPPQ
jgi:hypothetical protein